MLGKIDTLKKAQYFKTWLTRILINHCYDILRQKTVYVDLDQCEEVSKYDEYNVEFKEALRSLDERYRLPMELYYEQGYKVKEIQDLKSLFELAGELYKENIYAYYFDIPFEETVKRHQTRAESEEFGEEALRRWWREKDYSDVLVEKAITAERDQDGIVQEIYDTVMEGLE